MSPTAFTIRTARRDDAVAILEMIQELADFENEPDAVNASVADIAEAGWGKAPRFDALIAEDPNGAPLGFALYYRTFSTWEGRHGIFVEDLYVKQAARGSGIGRALLAEVAKVTVSEGCIRLELNVLHWNPAREFYHAIGFRHLDEWMPYRLEAAGIKKLATT
ncbi:MAG: GNAT family N-acetyltransferase [Pseudomonadota bacterium]